MNEQEKLLSYLKKVTGDLHETRRRLREAESASREPVAIVAMSCRFPGGADSPEALWRLLESGGDAVTDWPADRGWNLADHYDPEPGRPGKTYSTSGGALSGAGDFDASFFGISPREALAMDPQQRLLLEISWEAFERAGIDPTTLRGSRTGVFAGTNGQDYPALLLASQENLEGHVGTGNAASVVSGRVSYTLGLEGPAVTVDTACSSSLVALHLAVRALRAGECDLALAGGVTVMSTPGLFLEFSRQRGLAPDGRCKAFAESADGTGWAEGAGMLLVERLADARRLGHPVLAVVRGSAVNQDGASNGLTAPNGPSQQRVIWQALSDAQLSTADVDAVEAHGTGTTLGDPIEAQALLATYGQDRERPLWLGSVKSNIGHTQAAAGVAGVIKTVQAMRHGLLPRTLHVDRPTSHVDWTAGRVELLTEARPWPTAGDRPRTAGVSSFGVSGTNAHVILQQATPEPAEPRPAEPAGQPAPPSHPTLPYVVSARGTAALRAQAAALHARLRAGAEQDAPALRDLAWSLATTRAAFEHRAVLLAADRAELLRGLEALAAGAPAAGLVRGVADADGRTLFVFPGQGPQWPGMATELLDTDPGYREHFTACAGAVERYTDWSVEAVLRGTEGAPALDRVDVVQPLLFVTMVSLARLWESRGVRPDAVVGHSQGEIAAACVAGALTLDDAARVVTLRSRALTALAGRGGMASVLLPVADVTRRLARRDGRVSVAAVNGPAAVVVSGDADAVHDLVADLTAAGVQARRIPVDYASHSAQVERIRDRLLTDLAPVRPRTAQVPFFSTVTCDWLDTEHLDAAYWYDNLRRTVRFADAVRALAAQDFRVFVESSPHPVLTAAVRDTLDEDGRTGTVVTGTLRRGEGGPRRFLTSLAELGVRRATAVDWAALTGAGTRVDLPTYAFQRRTYWPTPALPAAPAAATGPDRDARFWESVEHGETGPLAAALHLDEDTLSTVLPALNEYRRRSRETATADGWRYRVTWKPLPTAPPPVLHGTWLVAVPAAHQDPAHPAHARTDAVVDALARAGADPVTVAVSAHDDRTRIAELLAATERNSPHAVLSLLALSDEDHDDLPGLPRGFSATVGLVQALDDLGQEAPVWFATRGAVATGPTETVDAPDQALVWGFARVVALEQPQRWGGLIDLPATLDTTAADRLTAALAGLGHEDQLAVRPTGLLARRLTRAATGGLDAHRDWTPTGTVLVTGGTGALGRALARRLARQGAPGLLLLSRTGPDAPGTAELRAELTQLGAGHVDIAACDIADRDQLAAVLATIPAERPLTAVFHTAAVLRDGVVTTLTPDRLAEVLRVKAGGARNLDALTAHLDLTAFVLFSSTAGTIGAPGHANYAPGNAFLDALAQQRRSRGLPATAVAWGPWADGGMAEGPVGARLRRHGVRPMDPEPALSALQQALDQDDTTVAVTDIDWDLFAHAYTSARPRPFLDDLPDARRALAARPAHDPHRTTDADAPGTDDLARQIAALDRPRQRAACEQLVRAHAAVVLNHTGPQDVEPTRSFRELGFDSLTAVELRNALSGALGRPLPATLVFDYPTPAALAEHLRDTLVPDSAAETAALPAPRATEDDPVVITAMSCRFPGGVSTPEEFWRLLADGTDAITDWPDDRGWDLDNLYDPEPGVPGRASTRGGGFLDHVTEFDPAFFGVSPREALAMDPQQRLLLELAWEAFERAGIDPTTLRGSRTGVFAGTNYQDYASRPLDPATAEEVAGHLGTGNSASVMSGRVSYTFGLEGPAVTVDTACSSALVALHLAVQALRAGECDLALAGGVTVMSTPGLFLDFSRQRGLAADGRCKAFSDAADGAGFSEGAGLVLVERLSQARAAGRRVLAVVAGSAVNQDGASNGLTAPNGPSQQRVIRQALASAGLEPSDVDVVEAHGTGTSLGDPIEAQAVLATYGQGRERALFLGSVKSNIGHTQAAAGVAGVMKMVLALEHGVLPRTLHVDEPSSHVDWSAGAVELLTGEVEWSSAEDRIRRAGVSSFGISGTNAHVVLAEPPVAEPGPVVGSPVTGVVPWVVSGRTGAALRDQAGRLAEFVSAGDGPGVVEVAGALVRSRAVFEHRAVVWGADRGELVGALRSVAAGGEVANAVAGAVRRDVRTAFLFAGQGAQRLRMGAELYDTHQAFAEAFDAVDAELPFSLKEVVFGDDHELLNRTEFAQPALFAIEVALFRLLESWGVRPDVLAGHSIGEIAAAHVAGVWSLADACRLVVARGRLMQALPAGGAMVAVRASEEEVLPLLGDEVGIAAVNGPRAVVVSGSAVAVEEIAAHFGAQGRKVTALRVSHAFHSPLMEPMLADFRKVAESLTYEEPRLPLVSTLTGASAGADELRSPDYWVRHVRQPVRFADAVQVLAAQSVGRWIELGPDGTLTALTQGALDEPETAVVVPVLRKDRPETQSLLSALARLYVDGADVDWTAQLPPTAPVPLPTYAFQRRRYWLPASGQAGDLSAAGLESVGHPLLSAVVPVADTGGLVLSGLLSARTLPWLADHRVLDRTILPATAYLELAVQAGDRVGLGQVAELTLETPLLLPERGAVRFQLVLAGPDEHGRRTFGVHSRSADAAPEDPWTRHAQGLLADEPDTVPPADAGAWPPADAVPVEPGGDGDWYERFAAGGFGYGPAFRGLGRVWRRGQELFAEVSLPAAHRTEATRYGLHPALLDAAVQTLLVRALDGADGETAATLPFAWHGVRLHATGATALRVYLAPGGHPDAYAVSVTGPDGRPVATADGLVLRRITARQLPGAPGTGPADTTPPLLRRHWRPAEPQPAAPSSGAVRWALLGQGDGGLGESLDASGVHLECYADLASLAAAVDTGTAPPEVVLATCATAPEAPAPAATRELLAAVTDLTRAWVGDDRFTGSRLVLVTRGALATVPDEDVTDLPAATVWGLAQSAQLEHPGRLHLLDLDPATAPGAEGTGPAVVAAIAAAHPQGAVRSGALLLPEPGPLPPADDAAEAARPTAPFDADGTVLVTGATGALGSLVARHLAAAHGARRLLLASRRGAQAPGADALLADLAASGAEADLVACDVAEPAALEALLARVPADRPLTGVVHVAGVVEDATLTSLTADRIDAVLRPKADAAWHLHRLTRPWNPGLFLLFSSAAGTFGSPGQGAYAAANAFLDALAGHRRAHGLAATSVAWGLWAADSGMTSALSTTDRERMARGGMAPLTTEAGLALFDDALRVPDAAVVAVARQSPPAPRTRTRRTAAAGAPDDGGRTLRARLAGLDAAQRLPVLLDAVREQVATVLGHDSTDEVLPDRHFAELGFDSLTAVELRNRLGSLTGFRLPPTLVFDLDTPQALAADLAERFEPAGGDPAHPRGDRPGTGPARAGAPAEDTVGALFRTACREGRVDEGFALLQAVAGLRPVQDSPDGPAGPLTGLRLAAGDEGAPLVCFSSYVALAGVHQYARFATAFRGRRDVWALPTPGFGRGEPLPASLDVVARTQAEAALRCADGRPFVLTGSSSGGVLALAAARHLAETGRPPLGVALLDTYMPRADSPFTRFSAEMLSGMFDRESMFATMDADRLSAMSWYINMIGEWDPGALSVPVLLVRPSEPPVTVAGRGPVEPEEWQSSWDGAGSVAQVPGNHFTMMESHAAATAGALTTWIDTVLPPYATGREAAHRTEGA